MSWWRGAVGVRDAGSGHLRGVPADRPRRSRMRRHAAGVRVLYAEEHHAGEAAAVCPCSGLHDAALHVGECHSPKKKK